ncbi:hypothetical protein [Leisingera sp. F5]|uniref:hypothetical protein n=1 Tax=Leisingera sp. F5 TaxID=1813816 RepID=UPI000AFC0743|nr:hypothetical protein [Leisingera sp. F5]
MSEKRWGFTEVSSGRYLCQEHGGYCDASDSYLNKCPICTPGDEASKVYNPVQRLLRVINGLQERSKRNLTLATSVFGGLSVLKLLQRAVPAEEALDGYSLFFTGEVWGGFLVITALFLLLAIALFAASMAQVTVVEKDWVPAKTISEWEHFLAAKLGNMEFLHRWAGRSFVISVLVFAAAILLQFLC